MFDAILNVSIKLPNFEREPRKKKQRILFANLSPFMPVLVLIHTFTVVCSVTWPLHGNEAGTDLALILALLILSCKTPS